MQVQSHAFPTKPDMEVLLLGNEDKSHYVCIKYIIIGLCTIKQSIKKIRHFCMNYWQWFGNEEDEEVFKYHH